MTTLVFSDTHLTNKFDSKKFTYLKRLIESYDRVVINGDFWNRAQTTFDKFVNSKWKSLFPLLKEKKAIYIYGNHDLKRWCDERVNLFSVDQKEVHKMKMGKYILYIEHGHEITPNFFDRNLWIPPLKLADDLNHLIVSLSLKYAKERYLSLGMKENEKMKTWGKNNLKESEILVVGNSHIPEYDLAGRYINTGYIMNNHSSYLVIDGSKAKIVVEKY